MTGGYVSSTSIFIIPLTATSDFSNIWPSF